MALLSLRDDMMISFKIDCSTEQHRMLVQACLEKAADLERIAGEPHSISASTRQEWRNKAAEYTLLARLVSDAVC